MGKNLVQHTGSQYECNKKMDGVRMTISPRGPFPDWGGSSGVEALANSPHLDVFRKQSSISFITDGSMVNVVLVCVACFWENKGNGHIIAGWVHSFYL